MSRTRGGDPGLTAAPVRAAGRAEGTARGRPSSASLPSVRIAIVYWDPAVRSALRAVLEQVPGCQIVADGSDPAEVADQVRQHPSELVLVDVRASTVAGIMDLIDAAWHKPAPAWDPPADGYGLTPREREIMGLIATGLSNRQIADLLVISPKTVKNHVSNIYRRIGASSRSQAISAWQDLSRVGELRVSRRFSG